LQDLSSFFEHVLGLLLLGLSQTIVTASNSPENQKTETGKGTTVDDLARGINSTGQNVEEEIPKIGHAIGETFKKITEKSSGNKPAQRQEIASLKIQSTLHCRRPATRPSSTLTFMTQGSWMRH